MNATSQSTALAYVPSWLICDPRCTCRPAGCTCSSEPARSSASSASGAANPNLEPWWPVTDLVVRVGVDAGRDAHQHRLHAAGGRRQPLDLVELAHVVDDHQPAPGLDRRRQVGVGLVVAVDDHRLRLGAGTQRRRQLAGRGHVGAKPLPDHRARSPPPWRWPCRRTPPARLPDSSPAPPGRPATGPAARARRRRTAASRTRPPARMPRRRPAAARSQRCDRRAGRRQLRAQVVGRQPRRRRPAPRSARRTARRRPPAPPPASAPRGRARPRAPAARPDRWRRCGRRRRPPPSARGRTAARARTPSAPPATPARSSTWSKLARLSSCRSRLYASGSPLSVDSSPVSRPIAVPALPRTSSAASGFFFCGIIELPVAALSSSSAKPYSADVHSTSSSPIRDRCTIASAAA